VRNWRVVTAAVTAVLAGLAGVLAYMYLNGADSRAQKKVQQVDVYVAKSDIPAGMSGEEAFDRGLIGVDKIPQKNVPEAAINGRASIASLDAVTTLSRGQVITSSLFVSPAAAHGGTLGQNVPKDMMAMSFQVDPAHGVGNMIQPGDSINVLVSLHVKKEKVKSDPSITGDSSADVTAFLLSGLKVLQVGTMTQAAAASGTATQSASTGGTTTTTTAPSNQTKNLGLITVAVTSRQAEQLAHAEAHDGSTIYLTLNAPGFDPKTFKIPTEIVDTDNLFDQKLTYLDQVLNQLP
jgi:Flp pilus assembly protein CpaB